MMMMGKDGRLVEVFPSVLVTSGALMEWIFEEKRQATLTPVNPEYDRGYDDCLKELSMDFLANVEEACKDLSR